MAEVFCPYVGRDCRCRCEERVFCPYVGRDCRCRDGERVFCPCVGRDCRCRCEERVFCPYVGRDCRCRGRESGVFLPEVENLTGSGTDRARLLPERLDSRGGTGSTPSLDALSEAAGRPPASVCAPPWRRGGPPRSGGSHPGPERSFPQRRPSSARTPRQ